MKRKVLIVTVVGWLICLLGGGAWSWAEQKMHWGASASDEELQIVRNLYGAGLYEEAIAECDQARSLSRFESLRPQMLYVTWVANRQLGRTTAADESKREFLSRFPGNELSADLQFADAMDVMAAGDYPGADQKLASIETKFPTAHLNSKITQLRSQLAQIIGASGQPSGFQAAPSGNRISNGG